MLAVGAMPIALQVHIQPQWRTLRKWSNLPATHAQNPPSAQPELKHLLIVYHSQTGHTEAMADAVLRGASSAEVAGVETRMLRAGDAGPDDLLWADALILGTPENFGYMSGAIKDFLDRTYYPCEGKVESLPYAIFVSAGNDGSGALGSIQRIARGYPLRAVQEPIIARGDTTDTVLSSCEELGMAMAAGLEMSVF
jgi:flavodoxin